MEGQMRRQMMGVVVVIVVAVAVALQWPPAKPEASYAARAATPTEVTLALRSDGLAVQVERGDLTLTLQF
jgi:hypothetical protein